MDGSRDQPSKRPDLRYDEVSDPEFQKQWAEARHLDADQLETAFRHGFDSRVRFADRPFNEVEHYLRESWEGMGRPESWTDVCDVVRSGYERYKGAGFGPSVELGPEALDRFPYHTIGGSTIGGGTMGERPLLGGAEPVSEFEGEGGPPVGGEELKRADEAESRRESSPEEPSHLRPPAE